MSFEASLALCAVQVFPYPLHIQLLLHLVRISRIANPACRVPSLLGQLNAPDHSSCDQVVGAERVIVLCQCPHSLDKQMAGLRLSASCRRRWRPEGIKQARQQGKKAHDKALKDLTWMVSLVSAVNVVLYQ